MPEKINNAPGSAIEIYNDPITNGDGDDNPYDRPGFTLDGQVTYAHNGAEPNALVQVSHPDTLKQLDLTPGAREIIHDNGSRTVEAGALDALPTAQSAFPEGFDPTGFDMAPRSAAELQEEHRQATTAFDAGRVGMAGAAEPGFRMHIDNV